MTISGKGPMYDYGSTTPAWYKYAYADAVKIRTVTIEEGVTTVGAYALLWDFDYLTSVSFPDTLTYIGEAAFISATHLESVDIPGSVKEIGLAAFDECMNMTSVTFHEGLETIGGYAFEYCDVLASVVLPSTVKYIGEYAFYTDHWWQENPALCEVVLKRVWSTSARVPLSTPST